MESKTYLGRYRITLDQYEQPIRLRREGAASTYKAFDSQSSREVALEIIPAGSVRISVQSMLAEEAEGAKKLQQMNVPMLYDFGIEDNELIYATELVDGVSAEDWVTTHGPMPIGPALRIASQVVKALGAATFHGIFHHALNPSNIIIVPGQTTEGEWPLIKVMNFVGVAPNYSRPAATDASASDKASFVAPEQLETGNANFSSEIYSLGCTLWFLLSGVPPAEGAATVTSASRVPAPVRNLISRMLAADPVDRPGDPVVLHEQIEDCIAEVENKRVVLPPPKKPVAAPVAPVVAPTERIDARPRRPFPWQPLAVAAALLLFAGLAAMLLPQVFHMRSAQRDIGVPVGVPDSVAAAAATKPPVATPATSVAPIQPNESNGTEVAAAPGVLTSTAGGDENAEGDSTTPQNSSAAQEQPAQLASNSAASKPSAAPERRAPPVVASHASRSQANESAPPEQSAAPAIASNSSRSQANEPAPAKHSAAPVSTSESSQAQANESAAREQSAAPVVASNSSRPQVTEPAPPSEGPEPTPATRPSEASVADASNSPDGNEPAKRAATGARSPARVARNDDAVDEEKRSIEKPAATAKESRRATKTERRVATNRRPPEGRVRAQYLGTTPEGEMVFGLPSDERAYLNPNATPARRNSSARHRRRAEVRPAEPPDDLPVLPALPPDE
ncbi:MAG: protein kinase domain-containing protein [Chthoniobacterales bacterium]